MSSGRPPVALVGAGIVVVGVVAFLLLRTEEPPKQPASPETSATTSSAPAASSIAPAASALASAGVGVDGDAAPITSGAPVDLGMAIIAAKKVDAARAALAAGDPKRALAEIEGYQRLPDANPLRQEAVVVKITALTKVGRKTDALALAMSTRDDPSFVSYQPQIQAVLADAGL